MYPDLREYLGMLTDPAEGDSCAGESLSSGCHTACDRFEAALRRGDHPRIETILDTASEAERDVWFRELLQIELEYAQETGEPVRLQDYVSRFPSHQRRVEETFLNPKVVVPPQFASYRILERLGSGGMGLVCLGQHVWTGRRVAVKLLARQWCGYPQLVERFLRELQLLGSLGNENIVRIYDGGRVGRSYWFAMEYISGSDLQTFVDQRGAQPVGVACEMIRQAAIGLSSLAQRKLVHRDVKPGNLMLDETTATVKLLDLGLARRERGGGPVRGDASVAASAVLTQPGAIVGTPEYMAPEQWTTPTDAGPEADIYGLGGTLFFLLTGRVMLESLSAETEKGGTPGSDATAVYPEEPPHEVKKRAELLREAAERGVMPSLTEFCGTPPELDSVFQRMVARQPADRFRDPMEIVAAMEPFADAEALHRLCGVTEETLRAAGRDRDPVSPTVQTMNSSRLLATRTTPSAVASGEVTVVATTSGGLANSTPSPAYADEGAFRSSRRRWILGTAAAVTVAGGAAIGGLQLLRSGREGPGLADPDSDSAAAKAERQKRFERFVTDWATLPGPDGTWWFGEIPWMLPSLRTALFRRLRQRMDADDPAAATELYAQNPDRIFDLHEQTLDAARQCLEDSRADGTRTVNPGTLSGTMTAAQRTLLGAILRMNRTRWNRDSVLDDAVAVELREQLKEFEAAVGESPLADDRYTIAVLYHRIASVTPEPEILKKTRTMYEAAIAAYEQIVPEDGDDVYMSWTRALRRRCLVDGARFAAELLRDWSLMAKLLRLADAVPSSDAAVSDSGEERPDFLRIEGWILEAVTAAALAPGDGGGSGDDDGGVARNAGSTGASSFDRYTASRTSFRRVTRRLETGSTPGRLSTGLLAQCYEREAWVKLGFWMVRAAKSDFERALGLREMVRTQRTSVLGAQSRIGARPSSGATAVSPTPSSLLSAGGASNASMNSSSTVSGDRFSPEELLLFHNRHGIAMSERYLGNHEKAYDDYGGLLEEMWRRYWRVRLDAPSLPASDGMGASTEPVVEASGAMALIDETRNFLERLSNSSERRGDMILYHPFLTEDRTLRLTRYAAAAEMYDNAVRYSVDPKTRQVMEWKQTLINVLMALDAPSRRSVAESQLRLLPAMDAAQQKLLGSEFYRVSLLSAVARAVRALYTAEGVAPTTERFELLRTLVRGFWRDSELVTAHRRERLEILMLAASTLLAAENFLIDGDVSVSSGGQDTIAEGTSGAVNAGVANTETAESVAVRNRERVADVTLIHREVITAFRNEFRQLVEPSEMLPYLRPFYDQMIRSLLPVANDPDRLRQAAELILESRGQPLSGQRDAVIFWFPPDSFLTRTVDTDVAGTMERTETTASGAAPVARATDSEETGSIDRSLRISGVAIHLPILTSEAEPGGAGDRKSGVQPELLLLDFGRRDVLRSSRPLATTSRVADQLHRWLERPVGSVEPPQIFWSDVSCWGDCVVARQAVTQDHWTFHFDQIVEPSKSVSTSAVSGL